MQFQSNLNPFYFLAFRPYHPPLYLLFLSSFFLLFYKNPGVSSGIGEQCFSVFQSLCSEQFLGQTHRSAAPDAVDRIDSLVKPFAIFIFLIKTGFSAA